MNMEKEIIKFSNRSIDRSMQIINTKSKAKMHFKSIKTDNTIINLKQKTPSFYLRAMFKTGQVGLFV